MFKNLYGYLKSAVQSTDFLHLLEECGGKYHNGFVTWIKFLLDEVDEERDSIVYAIDISEEKIYLLSHENQDPGLGKLVSGIELIELADELYKSILARISIVRTLKSKTLHVFIQNKHRHIFSLN